MVRTGGLGRALGRRRRPIALASRHREPAPIVEDDPVDDPVVAADIHAPSADAGDDAEGFPGGPRDPSVLTEYADHVAVSVWNGEERLELKLSSHRRKTLAIEDLYPRSWRGGTGKLAVSIFLWGRLASPWMMWRSASSSHCWHLPYLRASACRRGRRSSERQPGLRQHSVMDHTYTYLGYEIYIRAYVRPDIGLLQLVPMFFIFKSGSYAWGAAALCWIYKHFPSLAECMANLDYDEVSPRACRWIATKATLKSITTAT
ncbi:hypothetical protein GmHk_16G046294 [Glycine max]|nr:hypothetical protein GmHk_16G046294 [Glycine max]